MVSIKSLLLLFFLPVSSFAFTLFANVTLNFANPKVPVYVVDDGSNSCANGNFTEQDLAGYVEEAVRYWNFVPPSNLVLEFKGIVNPAHTDFSNGELYTWDDSYPPAD